MHTVICPTCGNGFMTQRSGKYGTFYGCSEYPGCTATISTAAYCKWVDQDLSHELQKVSEGQAHPHRPTRPAR